MKLYLMRACSVCLSDHVCYNFILLSLKWPSGTIVSKPEVLGQGMWIRFERFCRSIHSKPSADFDADEKNHLRKSDKVQ
jgi:hypothetical protein